MSRIVIAGGTGLIGRALASEMAEAGNEVIVLSRHPSQAHDLPQTAHVVGWDGRTAQGWSSLASGAAAIVNLAPARPSPLPLTAERKRRLLASRADTGHAVVDAVRTAEVKPLAVIQASAIGYYGLHGDETVSEASPPGNDFLAQLCLDWEASTQPVEELNVRRAIIRTGLVLSPTGGILSLMALPFRYFVGGPLGSGRQYMSWIHIADHVRAIRLLIETSAARGAFNLTAPHPVTNAEFSRALGRALRRPSFIPTPGWLMRLVFGDVARLMLLGGQRVVPQRLQDLGFQFRFPELSPALEDLLRRKQ